MAQKVRTDQAGREELLREGKSKSEKDELIEIIQASKDDYLIHSVLTYANCLKRALKKK